MAKKITTEDTPQPDATIAPAQEGEEPQTTMQPTVPATPKNLKQEKNGEVAADAHTQELLKRFPHYPSLYIDSHGGIYAPDTAPIIRSEAVLYKNPYYNESKIKA